jgi:hypothetical protein
MQDQLIVPTRAEPATAISPPACPAPGFYQIPESEYRAIPAMNCSILDWCIASPAHLKAAIDGLLVREDTAALEFGRAFHVRVLEPSLYAERVCVKGSCASIVKSGPRKGEPCGSTGKGMIDGMWFCGTHGGDDSLLPAGVEYITFDDAARIERAVDAIKSRKIDNLRRSHGQFEVCVIGDLYGVRCKAKLDKYIKSPHAIIDLKKVAAPKSPREVKIGRDKFARTIESYGYGMRAAFYCDLVKAVTGDMPRWYWLVVEDGEPFTPAVYRAGDEVLNAGRAEYINLLDQYKTAMASGMWPGPADDPFELEAPVMWARKNGGSK